MRWRTNWSSLTASKKQGIPDIKKALQYLKQAADKTEFVARAMEVESAKAKKVLSI